MKKTNIFNKMLYFRREKQELADRKRQLLERIRYDIALIHQDAANRPSAARQQ